MNVSNKKEHLLDKNYYDDTHCIFPPDLTTPEQTCRDLNKNNENMIFRSIHAQGPKIRINGTVALKEKNQNNNFWTARSAQSETSMKHHVVYWAPNPAAERYSVSGSNLPFVSKEMAFSGGQNRGVAPIDKEGKFSFVIDLPNAHYTNNGSTYVRPHVNIQVNSEKDPFGKIQTVYLDNSVVPFRSLGHSIDGVSVLKRESPGFYVRNLENTKTMFRKINGRPRTQEEILTACQFPGVQNTWPSNFWGTCPARP